MKYVRSIPKTDQKECEELMSEGWIPLKEPKHMIVALLISLPFVFLGAYIGIIAFPQVQAYIDKIFDEMASEEGFTLWFNLQYIIDIYGYVVLHELLHIVFVPHFMKSDKTFFSIHLWGGVMLTEEILSKSRFIVISLMPFFLLTFVFPAVLIYGGLPISLITLLIIVNGGGSGGDIMGALLIAFQVPNGAKIRNVGTKTFYKV